MKDKLMNFFNKHDSYYGGPEDEIKENENKLPTHSECRKLKKENEKLKADFKEKVLSKFKSRRSIRKFSDQNVDWELIHNIIEAGLNGPVAGGVQNYKIIVVTNPKERKELGTLAFQQYWLADAPVILVIVRDNHRLVQLYPQEGESYAIQNTAALIENMLMMAHFYDLGACWVEAYDNGVLKENLKIPMEFKVDAIIPIGYPLENPEVQKDPMNSKVFYEKYGKKEK